MVATSSWQEIPDPVRRRRQRRGGVSAAEHDRFDRIVLEDLAGPIGVGPRQVLAGVEAVELLEVGRMRGSSSRKSPRSSGSSRMAGRRGR